VPVRIPSEAEERVRDPLRRHLRIGENLGAGLSPASACGARRGGSRAPACGQYGCCALSDVEGASLLDPDAADAAYTLLADGKLRAVQGIERWRAVRSPNGA